MNDDAHLIDETLGGKSAAFGRLVTKYQDRLYNTIVHVVGSTDDAQDVVQDAFVQAFLKLKTFQGNSAFFTWLYRIAINSTLTHLRKAKLRTFFSFEKITDDDKTAELVNQMTDKKGADRDLFIRELQEKLNEAMMKLSIKHRTVVTLFEIEGLSHEEIADVMGSSVGTVRSRLHYAKQILQGELQSYINP